jgi:hypothetical protein
MGTLEAKAIAVLTVLEVLGTFQSLAADEHVPPPQSSEAAQHRTQTLSGIVSDVSGTGIPGASITALCGSFLQTVTTELTGAYSL